MVEFFGGTSEQQTLVPVRLPSYISHLADEKVYAIIDESTKDKYSIQLAFEPVCQGQNVCTIGTMTGSSKEPSVSTSKEYDVLLHRGLKGRYTPMLCASYCSNSSIRWKQDGYYYSISLKAENKDDLLDAVNSAVDVALK